MSGQQLYDTLDALLAELPTSEIPDLNSVLQLSGSITLSDATCSQEVVNRPDNPPPPPGEDRPDAPAEQPPGAEPREPPLADTGASPWGPRATFAGLGALLAGGALLALRRRRPVDED